MEDGARALHPDALRPPGPAAAPSLTVLSRRADFVRASNALRASVPAFGLQARQRAAAESAAGLRVGFTCSKKVGNAVARNRAKRRLRAIARLVLPDAGLPGWDYVLIGRPGITATHDFAAMQSDLRAALARLHRQRRDPVPAGAAPVLP